MRFLSRLLDNSITLPGGYRIGIDPLIGLVPGVGDFVAAGLSLWLVWDAMRLGIRKRVVLRMFLNVLIETMVGAIPLLGDLFDAVWKANARNMRLVELHYSPALEQRSVSAIILFFATCSALVLALMGGAIYFVLKWIIRTLAL